VLSLPILIVDDETDFRLLLLEALEASGYDVEGAANGVEAVECIRRKHYALVFTDLNMPGGISGLDLLKMVQQEDPKTFCILMTGYATTESAIQALKRGAYDFIQKPFKLAELEASLERALGHYRTLRENEAYQTRLEEMVDERTQEILQLKNDIENLFEGFVQASVVAIESRDPSTSGHSNRVADLTVALAEAVNRTPEGPLGARIFTDQQLKEIRYASLLHDFGKVGVREQVLVKAKKLESHRLEQILQRFHQRDLEAALQLYSHAWASGTPFNADLLPELLQKCRQESRRLVDLVIRCNEPSVLPQEIQDQMDELEELTFLHHEGRTDRIIETPDILALRIPKGSLSDAERDEVNSHVSHTFRFLSQIPWTSGLSQVPAIAHAHHERLNGRGYPRRLEGEAIPLQSRLMAICDVYDALVAADRPYKVAVTVPRSLEILEAEVKAGLLDAEGLRIFLEAKIFELTMPQFRV